MKFMKNLVKSYVGNPTWQRLGQAKQEFRWRKNQHFMADELAEPLLRNLHKKNGYYVDVGANDGRAFSNTYHLDVAGWQGILVEPILHNVFRQKELRSLDRNHFIYAACVDANYRQETVKLSYSGLMTIAEHISSKTELNWSDNGVEFLKDNEFTAEIWAPAKTLTSILDSCDAPRQMDFLSLDVEGAESSVLRGLDFGKYKFEFICIETEFDSEASDLLQKNHYTVIENLGANQLLRYQ
jgi:FkbM family methyltransferase